jgi:hypothetical protein
LTPWAARQLGHAVFSHHTAHDRIAPSQDARAILDR